MTNREGRLRVIGPIGRCLVSYRLTETTVSVRARTEPAGCTVAFQFRGRAPAVFRHATRFDGPDETQAEASFGDWDLRPTGPGSASIKWIFDNLVAQVGAGCDAPASVARTRARIRVTQLLRALGCEVVARCDRRARELATTFREDSRFWVYQRIVEDPSGRVAQMACVCPGLLTTAKGLERTGTEGLLWSRALIDGIRKGRALSLLLSDAAATLSDEAMSPWALAIEAGRFYVANPAEQAKVISARRVLIRRAGSLVYEGDLFQLPPARFAPEDIPTDPVANARWYGTMRRASYVVARVWKADLRERLSSFVSVNEPLIAARARRAGVPILDPSGVDVPGLHVLMQHLVRFLRETGRRPTRHSNPRRLLAESERWFRERDRDQPGARLSELLRRIPSLGLGEVTSVTALAGWCTWSRLERIKLPRAPIAEAFVPGVEVRPIETPEALAEEGRRMGHCVGTWLPRVMAGSTWVLATRVGGEPITVALERRGAAGQVLVVEARRAGDELPTPFQRRQLEMWVERVNQAAGREGQRAAAR